MSDSQRYHEIEHQWGRYCCFLSEKCRILTIFLSIAAYKRTSHFYRELHLPVIILGRKSGITRSFMIRRIWTIREQGCKVVKVIPLKRSFFSNCWDSVNHTCLFDQTFHSRFYWFFTVYLKTYMFRIWIIQTVKLRE